MDGLREEKKNNYSYDEAVDEIARRYGVPKSVYQRMVGQESGDKDTAVSSVGAFSAWQIMPDTARGLGYDPQELKNEPLKAAEGGLRILRDNYKEFKKYAQNEKHAWMMAVAGYHGAPKNVHRDIKRGGYGLPDISDGAITTKQHVLKIFDGIKGETLDRSPLGKVAPNNPANNSGSQPSRRLPMSVNPDDLPTVSIGQLPPNPLKNSQMVGQTTENKLLENPTFPEQLPPPKPTFPVNPIAPPDASAPNSKLLPTVQNPAITPPKENPQQPINQNLSPVDTPAPTDADYQQYYDWMKTDSPNVEPLTKDEFFKKANENTKSTVSVGYQTNEPDELIQARQKHAADVQRYEKEHLAYQNQYGGGQTASAGQSESNFKLLPKDASKQQAVKTDDDIRRTVAGTVAVDLSKKPKGVSLEDYLFKTAMKAVGANYNLTDENVETAVRTLRQTGTLLSNVLPYSEINDDNYEQFLSDFTKQKGSSFFQVNVTRGGINTALTGDENAPLSDSVKGDYRTEQTNADIDLLTSEKAVGQNEFGEDIKPRDYSAKVERQFSELRRREENPDYDFYRQAEEQLKAARRTDPFADNQDPTRDEIIERAKLLKEVSADAKELEKIPVLGTLAARAMGGVGRIYHSLAGIGKVADSVNPFASIFGETGDGGAYKLLKNIGDKSVLLGQMTNPNGSVLYEAGGLPFDLARLALMSRLPGGAVVGFGVDAGLQSAGRDETYMKTIAETVKGGSLGALFRISGNVADKVANPLLKPLARIGTVTGGTFAVEKATGATNEEALYSAITGGVFEVAQTYGASLKGKIFRAWDKGKAYTGKVEKDGSIVLYEAKKDAPVDFELVLDPTDGVYKSKSDFPKSETTNRTNKTAPENNARFDETVAPNETSIVRPSEQAKTSTQSLVKTQNAETISGGQKALTDGGGESAAMIKLPRTHPERTTTRTLDVEKLTELDNLRGEQINGEYEQVAGKPLSDLIQNAEINHKNGILYTNAEATEILRSVDEKVFSGYERGNYYGRYLNPSNSAKIETGLISLQTSLRYSNPAAASKVNALLKTVQTALADAPHNDIRHVVTAKNARYGLQAARQEETAHGVDYVRGLRHKVGSQIYTESAEWQIGMKHLKRDGGYDNISREMLSREVAAKIWLNTAPKMLKLPEEKIQSMRDLYVTRIREAGKTLEEIDSIEKDFSQVSRSARNYFKEKKINEQSGTESTGPTTGNREGLHRGRIARTDGATVAGRKSELRQGVSGTRTEISEPVGRAGSLERINEFDRMFIEKSAKGDTELVEAVATEILYSKPPKKLTAGDVALELWNIPKATKASVDLSAAGRQGLVSSIPHPIIASKAFVKQLASGASVKYYDKFVKELEDHPAYEMSKATGLYLSTKADGADVNQREEQFLSRLLGEDAVFQNKTAELARRAISLPIRASERAYGTFLDDIRINVFADIAKQVYAFNRRKGISDNETVKKQIEAVAKFVNLSTGRGSLGQFEDAGAFLNVPFFSARLWASRFQIFNPKFYATLPPGARKHIVREFGTALGGMATVLMMAKLAGFDVETDYENPDFLKIRIGQYRYDISGGLINSLRITTLTALNTAQGEAGKAAKGAMRHVQSKFSPSLSAIVNTGQGTNFIGEPTDAKNEFVSLLYPISPEQLVEGWKKDGTIGIIAASPDMLGISTARYDNSQEIGLRIGELRRQIAAVGEDSPEAKELKRQADLWDKLYFRAKNQPGELPKEFSFNAAQSEKYEKEGGKPKKLSEIIEFYNAKKDTLFSFAKDELEFLIISHADYLQKKRKLTSDDLERVRKIFPYYDPPKTPPEVEKLKKPPSINKDYPKPPKGKKLPKPPIS